jgi:hypothetical protein
MALMARPDRETCITFLLEHSPGGDSSGEYLPIIEENVDLALWAIDFMPWGSSIPDSVFLRYVLPARVSQEPLVAWRPVFRDALLPHLQGINTIEEATVIIGGWCDSITDYQPTQMRDQSPFVTWSSGIGRCEELTVFYMDALRSMGIPCRQVYTPWWTTCDSNHAWPEVWTTSGWVYADASTEELDKLPAWFDERVSRAVIVVAIANDSVPGAVLQRGSVSIIPVTDRYAETGELTIADDSTEVTISVANYGALRPVLVMEPGLRTVELGEGRYFASWGWPVQGMIFEVTAGEGTVILPGNSEIPRLMLMNLREDQ